MCGIGGVLMFPMERTEIQMEFIRGLVSEIAIENMVRGKDSTGIATFKKDGSHSVLKHNVKATDFVELDTYKDYVKKNITNDTTNILIHTRFGTKGSEKNNDNNHPIVSATTIGVHNGMISNDDELFAEEGLFRQAEVDSEVIFRLLDKQAVNNRQASKTVAEKLSGVFAVAYVKKDQPNILNYFRDNNPTTFIYVQELNIILFASQKTFLDSALEYNRTESSYIYRDDVVNPDNYIVIEPPYNSIFQFDVSKDNAVEQLVQTPMTFEPNYDYYGYGGYRDYFRSGKSTTTSSTSFGIYEFIENNDLLDILGEDAYFEMIDLLDQAEKNEWQRGYKAGRETLDDEIKIRVELAKKDKKEVI